MKRKEKNKKMAPVYEGHANDYQILKEGYTSFKIEKEWLDTIRRVIGEELYHQRIAKAKSKYRIKD